MKKVFQKFAKLEQKNDLCFIIKNNNYNDMTTITYTVASNKIEITQHLSGQKIGTVNAYYAFTEGGKIYGFKLTPRGNKAAPIVISNDNYTFEKYASLDGTETIEEATFAITSQSEIQDKAIAQRLAVSIIAFLKK